MFLRNAWYVAARVDELDRGQLLARQILGNPVLLYRTEDGSAAALLDRCPHRLLPLSAGTREGDAIRCGYHGMLFAADGRCMRIPGQERIPKEATVTAFPTAISHGMVWLWMGDPTAARATPLPDLPWLDSPAWAHVSGCLHVAADYRLLSDNLLDLSHETYVHEGTIGNRSAETIADYPVKVSLEDGVVVRAARVMHNIAPPPWFALVTGRTDPIDRWQTAVWAVPSLNLTDTGVAAAGEDWADAKVARIVHLLTPETETSTHYHWVVSRNYGTSDAGMSQMVAEAITRTFAEDKTILELQQAEIGRSAGDVPGLALRLDDAPLRARRALNFQLRREQESGVPPSPSIRLLGP